MAQNKVSGLKEGAPFAGILWLVSGQVRQTKSGDPFWEGTFQDASGSITAKLWDSAEGQRGRVDAFLPVLSPGPLKIRARVDAFQGILQLTLLSAEPSPGADPALFSPVGKRAREDMQAEFERLVAGLKDPHCAQLLKAFSHDQEVFGLFCSGPAAKGIHHPWIGGLFEHSLALARNVLALSPCYPGLDQELLLCGCFLHDVGKSFEISAAPGFEYTTHGKLLGHIYMGAKYTEDLCLSIPGFPEIKRRHLVHLVLSHQGDRNDGFGSPVDPQTPEAVFFHHLDNLDAKVQNCLTALEKAEEAGAVPDFTNSRENPLRQSYYRVRPEADPPAPEGPGTARDKRIEDDEDGPRDPRPRLW
jgi:3'-5' exoribonuclease